MNAPSTNRVEVNFDGLRSAITPINLMFDGTLYRDLKALTSHISHAKKRLNAERPDFQGALNEINQLEGAFRSAVGQWENKLTGEIQRLKTAIEKEPDKAMGATKKINKYQAELTSGRGSTTSMPSKITQVRNQLLAASGKPKPDTITDSSENEPSESQVRVSSQEKTLPVVYGGSVKQILRKAKKLGDSNRFLELALAVFKNVSNSVDPLGEKLISQGVLYYRHQTAASSDVTDEVIRQKLQFLVVTGATENSETLFLQSIFPSIESTFEMSIDDFEATAIDAFEPLDDLEIVTKFLKSKFKEEDFKSTFNRYHLLREKAAEHGREEKFNPQQDTIHRYLTGPIFDLVGVTHETKEDEIRFVGEINKRL